METRRTPSAWYISKRTEHVFGRENSSRAVYNAISALNVANINFSRYNYDNVSLQDLQGEYSRLRKRGNLMLADIFYNYSLINKQIPLPLRAQLFEDLERKKLDEEDSDLDDLLEDKFIENMRRGNREYSFSIPSKKKPQTFTTYPLALQKPPTAKDMLLKEKRRDLITLLDKHRREEEKISEELDDLLRKLGF